MQIYTMFYLVLLIRVRTGRLNPRTCNGFLKKKGFESPITCYQKDSKYIILSGHRRWYAAQKFSYKKIPVFLVEAPLLSRGEELERLGSVQGGKVDWSVYEWAKYTYEMWIFWEQCSYSELARKLNKSSGFERTRLDIFRYYDHNQIEDKLIKVYLLYQRSTFC